MASGLANAYAVNYDPITENRDGYCFGGRYVDDCGHAVAANHDVDDIMFPEAYGSECNLVVEDHKDVYIFLGLELRPVESMLLFTPKKPVFENIVHGRGALSDGKLTGIASGMLARLYDQTDALTWAVCGPYKTEADPRTP